MNTELKNNKRIKRAAIILAVILALASAACAAFAVNKKLDVKSVRQGKFNLPQGFTVTAHAGAMGTEANTVSSLITLMGYEGADCVEVDVRFAADGTPILSHNKAEAGKEYTTLAEFFKWLRNYDVKVNLDLKEFSNLPAIPALAEEYGVTEKLFFTGVDAEAVPAVRENCPGIPYYLNCFPNKIKLNDEEYLASLADEIISLDAVGINLNYRFCSAKLVQAMHEKGLLVSVWTVDKTDDMYLAAAQSPDNITTRNPDKLSEILG